MKKFTSFNPMTSRMHASTEKTLTTNRLIDFFSSKKDNIEYSSQSFTRYESTRKTDTSIAPSTIFTELQTSIEKKTSQFTIINPKTNEKKTTEAKTSDRYSNVSDKKTNEKKTTEAKTSDRYPHLSYQVTRVPNREIIKEIPPFIIALASIPSAILACLILPYFVIKCRKFIKIRKIKRRQGRIVRDSGMIEMSSVINELYMPER